MWPPTARDYFQSKASNARTGCLFFSITSAIFHAVFCLRLIFHRALSYESLLRRNCSYLSVLRAENQSCLLICLKNFRAPCICNFPRSADGGEKLRRLLWFVLFFCDSRIFSCLPNPLFLCGSYGFFVIANYFDVQKFT